MERGDLVGARLRFGHGGGRIERMHCLGRRVPNA